MKISYIGMKTEEVSIKPGTMKVVMKPDAEILQEVVVTGMQKMDKRLFTGAATKISAENAKLDGLADVSRALEGRAAGVSVQNVQEHSVQHRRFVSWCHLHLLVAQSLCG